MSSTGNTQNTDPTYYLTGVEYPSFEAYRARRGRPSGPIELSAADLANFGLAGGIPDAATV